MSVGETLFTIDVSSVQAVALAIMTYYFGVWVRKRVYLFERFAVPSPVIGGMSFAFVLSVLQANGILKVNFDSSLQTLLMLAFFTTIGLSAGLKVVGQGGKLLIGFLASVTVLTVLQNLVGMGVAEMMGLDMHYGILAGSVSMMGGLGTSAAFGPYFEQTYGIVGGTAVAITAATFGMVGSLVIGAPFGSWLIRKYRVDTPIHNTSDSEVKVPEELDSDVIDSDHQPTMTAQLMKATSIVTICMALGVLVSSYLDQFITLPAYIGSMMVAAVIRNVGDFTGKYRVDGKGLNAVADISLVLFVTMAINSLKLNELVNLALPLIVILACQTILTVTFMWAFVFLLFKKSYDSTMLCVGGIGFSMGATANGLANMQAIAEKYGTSPKAWLIVSIVGAFLIDLINALLITWMGTW